ncbi:MAG: hypothetical protein JW990_19860, partial [Thermoleophilia bacterium]|nr:hypothetical protein [Thermoleophilia bacterium]
MTETNGLSRRDELERLMAELRLLRADADEPGFVEWRASADSTMSKMFGPRHRLTLALRNVSFASDFGQARARALALLTSAASLADTMPDPALATGQPPEITQQPEPKRERVLRRLGRKRDTYEAPSDILEQP